MSTRPSDHPQGRSWPQVPQEVGEAGKRRRRKNKVAMDEVNPWRDIHGLMSSGAVHGLGNLKIRISWIAKIAWVIIILSGMYLATNTVIRSIEEWKNNPIETVIDSFAYPVTNLQYPTITICSNDEVVDRWGFIRLLYDTIRLGKDQKIPEAFEPFVQAILDHIVEVLDKKRYEIEYSSSSGLFTQRYNDLMDDFQKTNLTLEEYRVQINAFIKDHLLDPKDSEQILQFINEERRKQYPDSFTDEPRNLTSEERLGLLGETKKLAFLTMLRNIGNLGTLLANFASDVIGFFLADTPFFTRPNPGNLAMSKDLQGILASAFSELLNSPEYNKTVSLYDFPAIIVPVKQRSVTENHWDNQLLYSYLKSFKSAGPDLNFTTLASTNPDLTMRIMKEVGFQGSRNNETIRQHFVDNSILSKMKLDLAFPLNDGAKLPLDMFALCQPDDSCRSDFHPVPTELGICIAYNAIHPKRSFAKTDFMERMERIYKLDGITDEDNPFMIKGAGQPFRMTIALDGRSSRRIQKKQRKFILSFNEMFDFFDARSSSWEVLTGQKTSFLINPIQIVTSEDIREIEVEQRGCRYADEIPEGSDSLFLFYSYKACQFECSLRAVINETGCVPWNVPGPDGLETCDGFGAMKFSKNFGRADLKERFCKDKCLPNCEEITFDYSVYNQDLLPDAECLDEDTIDPLSAYKLALQEYENQDGEAFLWKFQKLKEPGIFTVKNAFAFKESHFLTSENKIELCKEFTSSSLAMVNIEIKSPDIRRMKTKMKYSLTDRIGTLGGTFGLFTGMSLISMVEIGYWLVKILISFSAIVIRKVSMK